MGNMPTLIWLCIAAILVASMQIGFLFVEAGYVRSKNSINVAMKNIADFALAFLLFMLIGAALMFGSSIYGIYGWDNRLFGLSGVSPDMIPMLFFQAMFCGTAATIVSGAVAERMRFSGYFLISIPLILFVYPVIGHAIWGSVVLGDGSKGWLEAYGFVDAAGSTVVHVVGGFAALAAIIVLGARKGRFDPQTGVAHHIQGHSPVLSAAGALILFTGWLGFNSGGLAPGSAEFAYALLNTALSACAGVFAATLLSYLRHGVLRTEYSVNGLLAGLVAITASAPFASPVMASLLGLIAAASAMIGAEFVERKLRLDDAVHAFAVHGWAGVVGTIAVPIVSRAGQFDMPIFQHLGIQLMGTIYAAAFSFLTILLSAILIKKTGFLRVTEEEEEMGLNIVEHGVSLGTGSLEKVLRKLNDGVSDLSTRVEIDPFDEAAELASGFNAFLEKIEHAEKAARAHLLAEQAENQRIEHDILARVADDERIRAEAVNSILERFQAAFEKQVNELQSQSIQLAAQAKQLSAQADESEGQAKEASVTSGEAARIAQRVAQATDDLSATLQLMADDMGSANNSVMTAVDASAKGREAISSLEQGAQEIGKLVASINLIMRRTNMLALNAAIEAANAGEQGKSFAVVAGEIGTLATQTRGVSGEIQDIINNISGLIGEAVARFRAIDSEITGVTAITATAQVSATQQAAKGYELGKLVGDAAKLSIVAGENVDAVSDQLESTAQSVDSLENSAGRLKNIAGEIERNFDDLKSAIRK